ncbi:UNVERIFIED_CONTAM: hypothetical protein HDU68_006177 [Siphonaria sp. JEL0065]|nr:hypothetical protein HDU68_006177 [Siphonaria sp. JEL0065]
MKRAIADEVTDYKIQRGHPVQGAHMHKPTNPLHGPSRDQVGHVGKEVDEYAGNAMDVDEELKNREQQ